MPIDTIDVLVESMYTFYDDEFDNYFEEEDIDDSGHRPSHHPQYYPTTRHHSHSQLTYFQVAWTEALGGATAGAIADLVLYGIDSKKVQQQSMGSHKSGMRQLLLLYKGLLPTILLGSVPVFGSFFFLYAPFKQYLQENDNKNTMINNTTTSLWLPLASALCAIPATLIGVPSDVLKKRLVLGLEPSALTAIHHIVQTQGLYRGLWAGWHVNLIRDLPFAGVKLGLYEWLVQYYTKYVQHDTTKIISPGGASLCGIVSGVGCAILTNPLDVVNTRIKAAASTTSGDNSTSILAITHSIVKREGLAALYKGVAFRSVVLGLGSMIFWPLQRQVAHSLQETLSC